MKQPALFAVDIGNSLVKLGLFSGDDLVSHLRIPTSQPPSPDTILTLLSSIGFEPQGIDGSALCSVVPDATQTWAECLNDSLGAAPYVVGPGTDFGLRIVPQPAASVGRDRLVGAAAAYDKYGGPGIHIVVVNMGTATTVDAVSEQGAFLGGAIAPGVGISAEALFRQGAQLPHVDLTVPERAIGRTTAEAMQSGIVIGYAGLLRELLNRFGQEMKSGLRDAGLDEVTKPRQFVVMTGGWSRTFFYDFGKTGDVIEEHLTLEGIRRVWMLNRA